MCEHTAKHSPKDDYSADKPITPYDTDNLKPPPLSHCRVVLTGGDGTKVYTSLEEGDNLVGRAEDCQIKLTSPLISRKHCNIHVANDTVTIIDLGSRNGTQVNGEFIIPGPPGQKVKAHDTIYIPQTYVVLLRT